MLLSRKRRLSQRRIGTALLSRRHRCRIVVLAERMLLHHERIAAMLFGRFGRIRSAVGVHQLDAAHQVFHGHTVAHQRRGQRFGAAAAAVFRNGGVLLRADGVVHWLAGVGRVIGNGGFLGGGVLVGGRIDDVHRGDHVSQVQQRTRSTS